MLVFRKNTRTSKSHSGHPKINYIFFLQPISDFTAHLYGARDLFPDLKLSVLTDLFPVHIRGFQ